MSDEEVKRLIEMMAEMTAAIGMLTRNQERFIADLQRLREEQAHAAKALGEIGLLLQAHAAFISEISSRVGVESVEAPKLPEPN